jgi:hypothetical protein
MDEFGRADLRDRVKEAGEAINKLRETALTLNMPFIGGLIRGSEETLLVAYTLLADANVSQKEL